MTTYRRITISVPEEIAAKIETVVDHGKVQSMSDYFSQSAAQSLAQEERDADAWAALDEIVGDADVSEEDRAWARSVLGLDDSAAEEEQDGVKSAA